MGMKGYGNRFSGRRRSCLARAVGSITTLHFVPEYPDLNPARQYLSPIDLLHSLWLNQFRESVKTANCEIPVTPTAEMLDLFMKANRQKTTLMPL
jgi:hypothetical protein